MRKLVALADALLRPLRTGARMPPALLGSHGNHT